MIAPGFSGVRGFNYQPSYGGTGVEIWRRFDRPVIEREVARGKQAFPGINTLRLWLSFDAFLIDPATADHLEDVLDVLAEHGLRAVVTIFNGWHSWPDFGGITPEHMSLFAGQPDLFGRYYAAFVERVVGRHARDERVVAWDLCNEPFNCGERSDTRSWLRYVRDEFDRHDPFAPAGISVGCGGSEIEAVEELSDVLLIHPYLISAGEIDAYRQMMDRTVEYAGRAGKALLATECCWGSLDDAVRSEIVRLQLSDLTARGVGWLAHLLSHTAVADGHGPEDGPVTQAGYMAFIERDGTVRAGHGVFNEI